MILVTDRSKYRVRLYSVHDHAYPIKSSEDAGIRSRTIILDKFFIAKTAAVKFLKLKSFLQFYRIKKDRHGARYSMLLQHHMKHAVQKHKLRYKTCNIAGAITLQHWLDRFFHHLANAHLLITLSD